MILKNWYKAFAANLFGQTSSITLPCHNGTEYPLSTNASYLFASSTNIHPYMGRTKNSLNKDTNGGVFFGDSSEPATIDDYWLKGTLITGFTSSASVSKTYDDDGQTLTGTYTITNNNDTEITIAECVLAQCYSTGNYRYFAYDRTVLETPVTIPAGGIGQVTYTIRMNYPV